MERLQQSYDDLCVTYRTARKIIRACPDADGARLLAEMLALGEEKRVLAPAFKAALQKRYAALKRKQRAGGADGAAPSK